jgi:hypothetical protein
MASTRRSTSFALGAPRNVSRCTGRPAFFNDASTSCPTRPHTRSSATSSGVDPIGLRYSPSWWIDPLPWT